MISSKAVNAINLCVLLACHQWSGPLTTKQISQKLNLSISYLEEMLSELKKQGLLLSTKGPGGGYRFAGDPAELTVWDIASKYEQSLQSEETQLHLADIDDYELGLEQVVMNTLKGFRLSHFIEPHAIQPKPTSEIFSRFNFKPLPKPFIPQTANSVFQLHMWV